MPRIGGVVRFGESCASPSSCPYARDARTGRDTLRVPRVMQRFLNRTTKMWKLRVTDGPRRGKVVVHCPASGAAEGPVFCTGAQGRTFGGFCGTEGPRQRAAPSGSVRPAPASCVCPSEPSASLPPRVPHPASICNIFITLCTNISRLLVQLSSYVWSLQTWVGHDSVPHERHGSRLPLGAWGCVPG